MTLESEATTASIEGADYVARTVPDSGRVYAPQDWREGQVHVLVPANGYQVTVDPAGFVRVEADALKHRLADPGSGQGPPQFYIGHQHAGRDAVLVRVDPET